MKYSQAKPGRIFVLRLEDGDIVHEVIESFAREHAIGAAALVILGGADKESRLVVGPEAGRATPMHGGTGNGSDQTRLPAVLPTVRREVPNNG